MTNDIKHLIIELLVGIIMFILAYAMTETFKPSWFNFYFLAGMLTVLLTRYDNKTETTR